MYKGKASLNEFQQPSEYAVLSRHLGDRQLKLFNVIWCDGVIRYLITYLVRVRSLTLLFCAGAWLPSDSGFAHWIKADLLTTYRIESVTTQGRPGSQNHWVTAYFVGYSLDGISWVEINTLFEANRDSDTKKTNLLPDNIEARYIRLRPWWDWLTRISMRFDVTGCAVQGRTSLHILIANLMSFIL